MVRGARSREVDGGQVAKYVRRAQRAVPLREKSEPYAASPPKRLTSVTAGELHKSKGANRGIGVFGLMRGARRGELPAADGGGELPHSIWCEAPGRARWMVDR